jgi:hypothetical protein
MVTNGPANGIRSGARSSLLLSAASATLPTMSEIAYALPAVTSPPMSSPFDGRVWSA